MTFTLDPEVAVVLEQAGPMPAPPPVGDVEARRGALNGMLEQFNNVAQPIAATSTPSTSTCPQRTELRSAPAGTALPRATAAPRCCICTAAG
jgi:hypothetical protein